MKTPSCEPSFRSNRPSVAVHVDPLSCGLVISGQTQNNSLRSNGSMVIFCTTIDGRRGPPGGDAGGDVASRGVQTVFAAAGELLRTCLGRNAARTRRGGKAAVGRGTACRSLGLVQLHPHHFLAAFQDRAQLAQGDGIVEADVTALRRLQARQAGGRAGAR